MYRQIFIISTTFVHLTSKKNKFIWSSKEEAAFESLKKAFINTVILEHPDAEAELILQTDSCECMIGVI